MENHSKVSIFSIGLIRGLIGLIIGWLVGMLLVTVIRLIMGLPAWNPLTFGFTEPAWVLGAILGVVGFIYATGVLNDWLKWTNGEETPEHPTDKFPSGWARYLSVSYDHKAIGIQYGVTSLILLSVAGLFALIFRTELLNSGLQFLALHNYNTIMSLHGIVMIGGILLGVELCRTIWFLS